MVKTTSGSLVCLFGLTETDQEAGVRRFAPSTRGLFDTNAIANGFTTHGWWPIMFDFDSTVPITRDKSRDPYPTDLKDLAIWILLRSWQRFKESTLKYNN